MTVSKALRDAKDISVKTKARIRQLALEMGYVPDAMAQSLRTRRTRLIGVMISSATNPIFARTLMAIEEWAFQLGYELLIAHSLNQIDRLHREGIPRLSLRLHIVVHRSFSAAVPAKNPVATANFAMQQSRSMDN